MKIENKYMLKIYLKRIAQIRLIINEYTNISDMELVRKLQRFLNLYLNELHYSKTEKMDLL